jgi:hypothetical protein
LKKAVGSQVQVSGVLHSEFAELQVPEKVLQCRLVNMGDKIVLQSLIKWSGAPESLASREDVELRRQRFLAVAASSKGTQLDNGDPRMD